MSEEESIALTPRKHNTNADITDNPHSRPGTNSLLFEADAASANFRNSYGPGIDSCKGVERKQNMKCPNLCQWVSQHLSPTVLCPTSSFPLKIFTIFLFLILLWGTLYTLFEEHVAPRSNFFILASLVILAYIAGHLISFLKLPPLLGMLVVGIIMRNINIFNMDGPYKIVVSNLSYGSDFN